MKTKSLPYSCFVKYTKAYSPSTLEDLLRFPQLGNLLRLTIWCHTSNSFWSKLYSCPSNCVGVAYRMWKNILELYRLKCIETTLSTNLYAQLPRGANIAASSDERWSQLYNRWVSAGTMWILLRASLGHPRCALTSCQIYDSPSSSRAKAAAKRNIVERFAAGHWWTDWPFTMQG
jgi:hypothetical protein